MDSDSVGAEQSALRRKLESKTEALLILSQELNKCRIERDQFKLIADRVQSRNASLKSPFPHEEYGLYSGCYSCNSQLQDIKEKNRSLILEVEDLKHKLQDARGDIKVLRRARECRGCKGGGGGGGSGAEAEWKEEAVRRTEEAAGRAEAAERALREAEDWRAEAAREAAALTSANLTLRSQLSAALHAASHGRTLDLDSLLVENKYLQERLEQALAEKELCQQTLTKYKGMLDKRKTKGSVKLGTRPGSHGMVVTHKQVEELLEGGGERWETSDATLADLRSLCVALLDALQDKSLALAHQRKANKILAGRVTELESRLGPPFPLLESSLSLDGLLTASTTPSDPHSPKDEEKKEISEGETIVVEPEEQGLGEDSTTGVGGGEREGRLPADLQELVMKAMLEIKLSSHSID